MAGAAAPSPAERSGRREATGKRKGKGERARAPVKHVPPPLEHRILMTATLCLLAFGAVMVYSASSPIGVLGGHGNGTAEFLRYLIFAAVGVVAFSVTALLIAAGMPLRYLGGLALIAAALVALLVLAQPYQQARLLSFLHPWSAGRGAGYQAVQGQIALGSGGLLGVGLGRSVQKIFYLPEAQTDFILGVIGEELGVLGIFGVVCLYGMIAYAGLRAEGAEVIFVGGERAEAELVPSAGYDLIGLRVAPLPRRAPIKAVRAGAIDLRAFSAASRLIRRLAPDAVLGAGGYVAGPVGLAAVLRRVPLVLMEADSHLGLTNRLLAPVARRVCLAFPLAGRTGGRD